MKSFFLFLCVTCLLLSSLASAQDGAMVSDGAKDGTKLPVPRFVSLKTDNSFIRTGPSMNYPIKWIYIREGLPVEVIQEFETWRKIRDPNGDEGWANQILLSGVRTAIVKHDKPVILWRDEKLSQGLAQIEPKVIGEIKSCDGPVCEIRFSNYTGFLEKKYLWGIYEDEKLK
jgi:SH3-like domain-containing protein